MDLMIGSNNKDTQNIDLPVIYHKSEAPSKAEKLALIFSYPIAFLYTYIVLPSFDNSWLAFLAVFTALFCISAELFYHRHKATIESYIWLGCIVIIVGSMLLNRNHVWGDGLAVLFIHGFAVYWILNRSGRLTEGRSGPFAPIDMFNGSVLFPFKHFFLRIKVLWSVLISKARKNGVKSARMGSLIAAFAGMVLFYTAGTLLASADDTFNRIVGDILKYLSFDLFSDFPVRFMISLLVGAYLYGLIIGTSREETTILKKNGDHILKKSEEMRKVPALVLTVILGAFAILYLLFFVIQGSYLFGAFTRTLPEGFTVSQYARQGFFELCKIMVLNFVLIWLVVRSGIEDIRNNRTTMIMCSMLLAESLLFSVTAFSKLILYISCFGFTPLRLQSTWLICVLFVGTALTIYSLWTRKRSFRIWIYISGISLALLHLY